MYEAGLTEGLHTGVVARGKVEDYKWKGRTGEYGGSPLGFVSWGNTIVCLVNAGGSWRSRGIAGGWWV